MCVGFSLFSFFNRMRFVFMHYKCGHKHDYISLATNLWKFRLPIITPTCSCQIIQYFNISDTELSKTKMFWHDLSKSPTRNCRKSQHFHLSDTERCQKTNFCDIFDTKLSENMILILTLTTSNCQEIEWTEIFAYKLWKNPTSWCFPHVAVNWFRHQNGIHWRATEF